jgi:hypothetical protein
MASEKGRKAWVVRWEWAGAHAAVERGIAAVLPAQWRSERVRGAVELLYAAHETSPADMFEATRRNSRTPYPATFGTVVVIREDGVPESPHWLGEVICGHNPYLVARLATVTSHPTDLGSILYEDYDRPEPMDLRTQSDQTPVAAPLTPPG